MIFEENKPLNLTLFQYITYIPKKNGSFPWKQKCLMCILDCYSIELNTTTLPDFRWSFHTRVNCWKPIPFVAMHFVWNVTGFLNLPLIRLTLMLSLIIIYRNQGATLESKTDPWKTKYLILFFELVFIGSWLRENFGFTGRCWHLRV